MTSITRLRLLNLLYSFKETSKCMDAGVIAPHETTSISELIKDGFAKLEYMYLLKTKKAFSLILDKEPFTLDYTKTTLDYARFSLYVLLIGYLDSHIQEDETLYKKLTSENDDRYVLIAGRIADAFDFRKCILADYAYELDDDASPYLSLLSKRESILASISKTLEESPPEDIFTITGFYQSYLEGYKNQDEYDIKKVINTYQTRKKSYAKYRAKCVNDLESIGALLIKENKPLL